MCAILICIYFWDPGREFLDLPTLKDPSAISLEMGSLCPLMATQERFLTVAHGPHF